MFLGLAKKPPEESSRLIVVQLTYLWNEGAQVKALSSFPTNGSVDRWRKLPVRVA
jgi:hypothetical protein